MSVFTDKGLACLEEHSALPPTRRGSDRARGPRTKAARRTRFPRTAFVLSGGASLGAMQVGMLYERGVRPDLLVGTSAGALNAAFIASRPQTVATTAELAQAGAGFTATTSSRSTRQHFSLLVGARLESDLARYAGAADVIVLPPANPERVSPADFEHADRLIAAARAAARAVLTEDLVPEPVPGVGSMIRIARSSRNRQKGASS